MENFKARNTKLVRGLKVVEQPSLIEVMTMKTKFVEQIRDLQIMRTDCLIDWDITYLGRVKNEIILKRADKSYLEKITVSDLIQILFEETVDSDIVTMTTKQKEQTLAEFKKDVDALPQIFAV